MTDEVEDFFNTPMGTIPRAPVLPGGTYLGRIHSYKTGTRKFDETEIHVITLVLKVEEATQDVDEELLASFDLNKTYTSIDFRMDPEGRRRFDQLLVSMFGENKTGAKIGEYLPTMVGKIVQFFIKRTQGKTAGDDGAFPIYANVTKLVAYKGEE